MKKEDKKLLEAIVAGMQERKAKRVVTVDMTKLDAPCQYFVICEGDSNVHVSSIAMEVKDLILLKLLYFLLLNKMEEYLAKRLMLHQP